MVSADQHTYILCPNGIFKYLISSTINFHLFYQQIQLQPNCEKLQPLLRQSHNDYNLAVLVGIIFSCFGIILIIMAFFLWR